MNTYAPGSGFSGLAEMSNGALLDAGDTHPLADGNSVADVDRSLDEKQMYCNDLTENQTFAQYRKEESAAGGGGSNATSKWVQMNHHGSEVAFHYNLCNETGQTLTSLEKKVQKSEAQLCQDIACYQRFVTAMSSAVTNAALDYPYSVADGLATLTDLPPETTEMICCCLANPSDRFNLSTTTRSLLQTVEGSWRDLQSLQIDFASSFNNPDNTTVHGRMKRPGFGEWSEFKKTVGSAKLLAFLTCIGPHLPSLKLQTKQHYANFSPPLSAADGHPISVVLSACADATVLPSVIDVYVESRRLLFDRSLLDALIRWVDCRHRAADNDDTPFWRRLILDPGFRLYNMDRYRTSKIELLQKAHGDAPVDIRPLLDNGIGEVMLDADDPTQADSPSSRWCKGLKELQIEHLRKLGSDDPEGVTKLVVSLLQQLMDGCESLQAVSVDRMMLSLDLRPTVFIYPKTLTELKCDRLGVVAGEIEVIVQNCPLLEKIQADCWSMDSRDIVALTKLNRLKRLQLKWFDQSPEFTLVVCGVDSVRQLQQIGSESSPWPMLEKIHVTSHSVPHLFVKALINCCSELSRFSFEFQIDIDKGRDEEESELAELMLDQLCRLPRLTKLDWSCDIGPCLFGSHHVDTLTACCPNLQKLDIDPPADVLWFPRLLRGCPELRAVDLFEVEIDLNSPEHAAMFIEIAADVGARNRRVVIKGCPFVPFPQATLDAVAAAFPPDVRMLFADIDELCLHDRRRCSSCGFKDNRLEDCAVIGHCRRLHAVVLFIC